MAGPRGGPRYPAGGAIANIPDKLVVAAFVLIKPGLASDLIGAVLVAAVIASQVLIRPARRARPQATR